MNSTTVYCIIWFVLLHRNTTRLLSRFSQKRNFKDLNIKLYINSVWTFESLYLLEILIFLFCFIFLTFETINYHWWHTVVEMAYKIVILLTSIVIFYEISLLKSRAKYVTEIRKIKTLLKPIKSVTYQTLQ